MKKIIATESCSAALTWNDRYPFSYQFDTTVIDDLEKARAEARARIARQEKAKGKTKK